MLDRLKTLYQLQVIDDQLDELEELRGDLPNTVKELTQKINNIKADLQEKQDKQQSSLEKRKENEEEIEKIRENQKKFKAQLFQVRNNKEYDALTKEIDHSDGNIQKLEEENAQLENLAGTLTVDIDELGPILFELEEELESKEADLKEIIKLNAKEEAVLTTSRKQFEGKIKGPDYSSYMKIRKAKKGIAVATIKRSACSGCHNIVPSQRQLEIRRNNKLFYCEHCGRILVSPEAAEINQ
ncbi:MAG: C4-type zinc ribbon domain-containing protein [Bacteroidota bacterium]|nr:C4-type zinc ribbon domain-containing protein [Bacteroidota bacterium]